MQNDVVPSVVPTMPSPSEIVETVFGDSAIDGPKRFFIWSALALRLNG
jgi:hypothetical protein